MYDLHPISRRRFLQSAGMLALASQSASAISPIPRRGPSVFKSSLAAYSFRDSLAPKSGKPTMDLLGFVDYCAKLKLHGTELTSYYFPAEVTKDYLKSLKKRCDDQGLAVSGGAIRNDFCQLPGEKLTADIEHTRRWIDNYAQIGAPTIRVFAGNVPKGQTEADSIKRVVDVLGPLCDEAAKAGVILGLENHGGITKFAEPLLDMIKAINSKGIGINWDSGNFRDSDDPYAELAKIAPYAVSAQVKTEIQRKGHDKEESDVARIIKVLRDAQFSGWVALEYEAKEDPYVAVPRHIETLKKLLA